MLRAIINDSVRKKNTLESKFRFEPYILIVIALVMLSLGQPHEANAIEDGDGHNLKVIMDVDNTLLDTIASKRNPKQKRIPAPDRFYQFDGYSYETARGIFEFFSFIHSKLKAAIGINSAGPRDRNVAFSKSVLVSTGITLFDILFKVVSWEEIQELDPSFTTKDYQKNLRLSETRPRLDQVIIVDDSLDHTWKPEPTQKKCYLKIYRDRDLPIVDTEVPVSLENNLIRALGILIVVLERAKINGTTPVDELTHLQWDGDNYSHKRTNTLEVYQKGLHAFRSITPEFTLVTK